MSVPTTSVDPAEIAKFDALASRWWDPRGEFAPLHQLNPVRLAYLREHARLHGARLLDVGCGGGILSEALAREGAKVVGIDLAPGATGIGCFAFVIPAKVNLQAVSYGAVARWRIR